MTRILVVEGDAADARTIRDTLSARQDWQVTQAATILEAIRLAGEETFDAAVLDADLPDGSGLDILDFLRIGSPGIQILLLGGTTSEATAFHALSHGAGDYLVKDTHLEQELPRRMHALLDGVSPEAALIETLTPAARYDVIAAATDRADAPVAAADGAPSGHHDAAQRALDRVVGGSVIGAAVYDLRGKTLAVKTHDEVDADGLGFALATLHGQVGGLWTYAALKPTGYEIIIDIEDGTLALTAIPGTYIVALVVEADTDRKRTLQALDGAARKVYTAMNGGAADGRA